MLFFKRFNFFALPLALMISGSALLSLIYMNYGLWAAIGCHLIWNILIGAWVKAFHLSIESGAAEIEGALTTTSILILTFLLIFFYHRRYR